MDAVIIKRNKQITEQKNDLDRFSTLDLQKTLVTVLKIFVRRQKEEMKRNQGLAYYMYGLKVKIVRSRRNIKSRLNLTCHYLWYLLNRIFADIRTEMIRCYGFFL